MLSFSMFSGPSFFVYGCVYDAVSSSGDILPNGRFSE